MPFVPENFEVPKIFETDKLRLRMLTPKDLLKDYDAIMSSAANLRGVFGPTDQWPTANLTLEQDRKDLEWHQGEFENRSSFAYTVVSLDESECLGCVYIFPPPSSSYDAMVIMWVRASQLDLDEYLFITVKEWLKKVWPFKKVVYPGRETSWESLGKFNIKFSP